MVVKTLMPSSEQSDPPTGSVCTQWTSLKKLGRILHNSSSVIDLCLLLYLWSNLKKQCRCNLQSIQKVTRSAKYQDLTLHIYFILALNLESYHNFREIFSEILNIYKEDLSKRENKIFNLYLIEISTPPAWIG